MLGALHLPPDRSVEVRPIQNAQKICGRHFFSAHRLALARLRLHKTPDRAQSSRGPSGSISDRQVIDIDGEGSLNMTIHELATCHRFGIGVKVVVINNQWLGMVRQWQDMIYDKHRSGSDLSDPMVVKAPDDEDIYPNFLKVAEGYRVTSERITQPQDLAGAYERMLANPDEPYLLDVIVNAEENVYPMIPAGGTYRDVIMGDEELTGASSDAQGVNI